VYKKLVGMTLAAVIVAVSGANAAESIIDPKKMQGSFSADMTLTNDYVFRGISQTDAKPAIQASIGYSRDVGPMSYGRKWCLASGSSGDQIDVSYLDTIFELYSGYHFGQVIEAA